MKHTIIIFLSFLILNSCIEKQVNFNKISVGNIYSISIPDYFTEVKKESTDSFKVFNYDFKNLVLIISFIKSTEEEKQNITIDEISQDILKLIYLTEDNELKFHKYKDDQFSKFKINNLDARQTEMKAKLINLQINITLTVIEGKSYFYYVQTWTPYDKRTEYSEEFHQMLMSFKEL